MFYKEVNRDARYNLFGLGDGREWDHKDQRHNKFYQFHKRMGLVGKEPTPSHILLHKLAGFSSAFLLGLENRTGGGFPRHTEILVLVHSLLCIPSHS